MLRITKTGALKASLLAILSVILVEGLAGLLTGSLALVSDAAHAAFDAVSTFALLVATTLSLKPADEDHTYGHGKIESIGALIGGVILLSFVGVIVYESSIRLAANATLVHPTPIAYAAAAYTMGIDILRLTLLTLALRTGSLTVRADLYHALSDFFSTGLVFVALGLASLGYPAGDTWVSLVLAFLLAFLSVRLIYSSTLDLSDAVSGKLVKSILKEIRRTEGVLKCKELRARRVGDVTYVDAVIAVSPFVPLTDADTIASKVEANLKRLLGKSSILIHVEPIEWGVPLELQIRKATALVEGARGLHNLSVASIEGGLYVTLHVQVDPALDLERAHGIAEAVERGIEESVENVRQVTVHLEPSMPETSNGRILQDRRLSETIRDIVKSYPGVLKVNAILTYYAGDQLHINVNCVFQAELSIERIHEMVSKIEEDVRSSFSKAIVTIHPEPIRPREAAGGR